MLKNIDSRFSTIYIADSLDPGQPVWMRTCMDSQADLGLCCSHVILMVSLEHVFMLCMLGKKN